MKKILHLEIDKNRIFGLDIIRAVAIMMVLLTHNEPLLPESFSHLINSIYFDGVSIFFVLSGFLIGNIFIKTFETKGLNFKELKNFWIRRWFRTIPAYFLFVFIIAILSKIIIEGFPLRIIFPYLVFCQNLFSNAPGFFGESWSLSIEEWFYLSIPFLILVLTKLLKTSVKQTILLIICVFLVFPPILRFVMYQKNALPPIFYQIVIYRADSIIYGVLGAYLSYYYSYFWKKLDKLLFYVGLALLLIWKLTTNHFSDSFFYRANIDLIFFSISILCLFPFLSTYKIKNYKLFHIIIIYISLISYSLYLVNYSLVKKLLIDQILVPQIADFPVISVYVIQSLFYWISTFIIAFFSYKYFELPTTKLRNLFSK